MSKISGKRYRLKQAIRRLLLGIAAITVVVVVFTIYVNVRVENAAEGLVFENVASVPRNRVALLLEQIHRIVAAAPTAISQIG